MEKRQSINVINIFEMLNIREFLLITNGEEENKYENTNSGDIVLANNY